MSRDAVEQRHRDAEFDALVYLAAVENGDWRLAADVLLGIGAQAPATFICFSYLARMVIERDRRIRELEEELR